MRLRLAHVLTALACVILAPGAGAAFVPGQCTTWAFMMRPEIVADAILAGVSTTDWNADSWAANAQKAGFRVGTTPAVGAIAVWPAHVLGAGPVGHVAYVQKVRPDGSFYISEEDYDGSPDVHYRWVTATNQLRFIYLLPGEKAPTRPTQLGGQLGDLGASGQYKAGALAETSIDFTVDQATDVALRLTGPGVSRTVTWKFNGGKWAVGLDKIAGASSLPAGTYKLIAFPYDTDLHWWSYTLRLA